MPEYHNVKSLAYDGSPATRVVSIQWEPMTGAIAPRVDGSGANVTLGVANAGFRGTISFLDQAQAAVVANKRTASKNLVCVVLNQVDADATITGTNVVTGPVRGFSHNLVGSGPYVVDFTCTAMSSPPVAA